MRRKTPELRPSDWILHQDNAPARSALPVKNFLAKKSITEMEQLKSALKGQRFQDIEDILKKCDYATESCSTT
jgi:hypothetical protein